MTSTLRGELGNDDFQIAAEFEQNKGAGEACVVS
jgi:hypothetical protein